MVLGSIIGFPIASASVGALQGLWKNDLVALKEACPNCGEEVFAFLKAEKSYHSPHRADCHVCGSRLEFQTKVEVILTMTSVLILLYTTCLFDWKNFVYFPFFVTVTFLFTCWKVEISSLACLNTCK
ncbi:hypothetical protein RDI58_022271 [Solanum bulbocastanum]|uniref:Uncharacterized protein n=1 Tax=Solanum bulbocastanum TaxID=147425 RepID=A0AAN8Y5M3_SOLBU